MTVVPYELYIRFLLTKGFSDLKDINSCLEELNLPPIYQKTLDHQFNIIEKTLPAGVMAQVEARSSYSSDFMAWMQVLEVHRLWHYEKQFYAVDPALKSAVKLVTDVHQDSALRMSINSLLIKNVPTEDLCQSINIKFSALLKIAHVEIYRDHFFAVDRMTRLSWREFIRKCDSTEARIYFTALSEPLDVLKTELEMPASISTASTLQYLFTKSYIKAKQYLSFNSPEANTEARRWIDTTLKISDKYEKYRSGDVGDFSNALQMEFDFVDNDFAVPDPDVMRELSEKLKKDKESKDAS